jgi:hypothetical protein
VVGRRRCRRTRAHRCFHRKLKASSRTMDEKRKKGWREKECKMKRIFLCFSFPRRRTTSRTHQPSSLLLSFLLFVLNMCFQSDWFEENVAIPANVLFLRFRQKNNLFEIRNQELETDLKRPLHTFRVFVFVSHQWETKLKPDPENNQMKALCQLFLDVWSHSSSITFVFVEVLNRCDASTSLLARTSLLPFHRFSLAPWPEQHLSLLSLVPTHIVVVQYHFQKESEQSSSVNSRKPKIETFRGTETKTIRKKGCQ